MNKTKGGKMGGDLNNHNNHHKKQQQQQNEFDQILNQVLQTTNLDESIQIDYFNLMV